MTGGGLHADDLTGEKARKGAAGLVIGALLNIALKGNALLNSSGLEDRGDD